MFAYTVGLPETRGDDGAERILQGFSSFLKTHSPLAHSSVASQHFANEEQEVRASFNLALCTKQQAME